jgi:DNA-binding GntR family transcriptional regulator
MLFTDKQHLRALSNGRQQVSCKSSLSIARLASPRTCALQRNGRRLWMEHTKGGAAFRTLSSSAKSVSATKWGWMPVVFSGMSARLIGGEMAKPNTLFKNAYNRYLQTLKVGMRLPSEPEIALQLGISRSTAHSILVDLPRSGIIDWHKHRKLVLRTPVDNDFYPKEETSSLHEAIERHFMQMVFSNEAMPGMHINELEFSREIGVATTSVREYLIRFSRFGLIEKRPNGRWILQGLTRQFALELANVRDMFELHSAHEFAKLPRDHHLWSELEKIEKEHRALLGEIDSRYMEFSPLDERFHLLVHCASNNRFITDFYDVISMVFHYHYQWNRVTQKPRNKKAIEEHLDYIAALKSGDSKAVEGACMLHLSSARDTLLQSVNN